MLDDTKSTLPESTVPYWIDGAPRHTFPALDRDLDVDVVVVGAGLTGITTAYLLKEAGQRVALLDRGRSASVDTAHTTAHLTCVTDARLSDLIRTFGRDHAGAFWDAGLAAIEQIDTLVRSLDIDCRFARVPGFLHASCFPDGTTGDRTAAVDALREDAIEARQLGFDVTFEDRVEFVNQPGLRVAEQARIHPQRYLAALLDRIEGDGSHVFEASGVDAVEDDPPIVVSRGRRITCRRVVIATHNPIVGNSGVVAATLLQTKLSLYSSYVVGGRVPRGRVPDALFWDTAAPYHYLRIDRSRGQDGTGDAGRFDYAIFGGEDHKTGQAEDTNVCFERVARKARQLMPELTIDRRWSGQVIETHDGLPLIGPVTPTQFAATGYCGNGMTLGTVAAIMARDWILGRRNPWQALFDVHRTPGVSGAWDYLKENKDYPYYLIRDRFAGAAGQSLRAVPRGEGRILELDGRRVAAYRDLDGSTTVKSAVCTHMGCVVRWNDAERTWDCPCHGSRFTTSGRVIAGPAETPLAEVPESGAERRPPAPTTPGSAETVR